MSVHRWKIESDSIPAAIVNPTWDGKVENTLENDAIFFRSKVGELKFQKSDYTTIKGAPDCEKLSVYLEEKCGETWSEVWRGTFTTYDVSFNENQCLAKVTPKPVDAYDCIYANWETDIVVAIGTVITVKPIGGVYDAGQQCCLECITPPAIGPLCAVPDGWCFQSNSFQDSVCPPDGNQLWMSCFHRIVGVGTPTNPPPYGTGWTYLSGNDWWRCPDGEETEVPVFDQGRWFNDVLEYMVGELACGLTVRSHFFALNNTHTGPPANDAYTFSDTYLQALQLHQKSDIKRPFSSDPAQSFTWKMNTKRLLEDLRRMFNVFFIVDGSDLIIEHCSYFASVSGIDLTQRNIELEYGKADAGAPNIEVFKWADRDATFTVEHKGFPISYGDCGAGKQEIQVNYFSNDVYYIATVENQEEVADAGFCLIATEVVDGENIVIDNNNPLGWMALHENLHKDRRYFMEGTMNDTPDTAFLTTLKTRRLKELSVKVCCDDGFNLTDTITTLAGDASVQKATYNYFQGTDSKMVKIDANI
jgi:hypothetical protein